MRRQLAITFILLCISSTAYCSVWNSRPGTISHARTLPDESHVHLDAVQVSKIRARQSPSYIVVADFFSLRDGLVLLTTANPLLRANQTVDVEGDMTTLESGSRALTNVVVWGYTDSLGNLLYHGPLLKGPLEPTPWKWKTDLTFTPDEQSRSASISPEEISANSQFDIELCSTIAEVKSKDIGTVVELRCKPVSEVGSGAFTVGEDDSSDTITANYTGPVAETDRICVIRGTVDTDGTNTVLDIDSGPAFNAQESYPGSVMAAEEGTIAWAKCQADSTSVSLSGKIITQAWSDYFYIKEDDRRSGIRVEKTAHGFHSGKRVDVQGYPATNGDYERYIAATTVTYVEDAGLDPLGMNNKLLGGGDFAYVEDPPSGQRGVKDGVGVNNIGLLVKVWGTITELDSGNPPQWFRIDDGAGINPKIAYPPYSVSVGDFVAIAGVSSCEYDGQNDWLLPIVRPQPLTVTINRASGQPEIANSTPINFAVVFSEPVTDFNDADDVEITGTAGGTRTVVITPTDSRHYNVAISDLTYGTVTVSVPAGKAQGSGVWNYASTSGDNTVSYCGSVVYVKTPLEGGSDSNSGWRWDHAKATVTAGLQTAVQYGQSQVWVAKGTFNERITLPAGVSLYGGFVGDETSTGGRPGFPRPESDPYETVLDGQSGGDVVTATSTNANNTLDGFTIRNGTKGVRATSTLSIRHNKIFANSYGIDITSLGSITDNRVLQNTYTGISLSGSAATEVSCNTVESNGGSGIRANGTGNFVINRNKVKSNGANASYGGGICIWGASGAPVVANNHVWDNHASTGGGGLAILTTFSSVYNNTIVENSCGGNGGGIWISSLSGWDVYVCNNIIESNSGNYGVYIHNQGLNYVYTVYMANNFSSSNGSGNYGTSGYNASFTFRNEKHDGSGLASGDYVLSSSSPCVDAGTTYEWNATRYYPPYDVDGGTRVVNTVIDAGCNEVQ